MLKVLSVVLCLIGMYAIIQPGIGSKTTNNKAAAGRNMEPLNRTIDGSNMTQLTQQQYPVKGYRDNDRNRSLSNHNTERLNSDLYVDNSSGINELFHTNINFTEHSNLNMTRSFLQILIFGYGNGVLNGASRSFLFSTFMLLSNRGLNNFLVLFWGNHINPVLPSSLLEAVYVVGHSLGTALRYTPLILQVNHLNSIFFRCIYFSPTLICWLLNLKYLKLFNYLNLSMDNGQNDI